MPLAASLPTFRLRKREPFRFAYGQAMREGKPTIYYLAQAAREARQTAGRKLVHIGSACNYDQSTIFRFEQGVTWPKDVDRILQGYAEDLGTTTQELWETALNLRRENSNNNSR